jgi:pimeloyl-ACP methyl ester carboxylesterase
MSVALTDVPLIFLPGLNGDPRVLANQKSVFPNLQVVQKLQPQSCETLTEYAHRLAMVLDIKQPCIVGGVSFGGIVALELARHVHARACILVSSTRDAFGLPNGVRILRPIAALVPQSLLSFGIRQHWSTAQSVAHAIGSHMRSVSRDERLFRQWALQALARWVPPADVSCDVFQIHGERDSTFPIKRSRADRILTGAGHLMTRTHANEVNAFIRDVIRTTSTMQSSDN